MIRSSLRLVCAVLSLVLVPPAAAADCNLNGRDDGQDVSQGSSPDCNGNGVPDECDVSPSLALQPEYALGSSCLFFAAWGRDSPVVASDLDSDGDPDLVTTNCIHPAGEASTVSILFNQGDGSFSSEVLVDVGLYPLGLIVADLDGDGDPDIATGNYESGDVSVLLNRGDGTFSPGASVPVPLASEMVAADFDGDGDLDLAVVEGPYETRSIVLLINAGDATFSLGASLENRPEDLAAADVDGDGDVDLIASGYYVYVFKNSGSAAFGDPAVYPRADMCEWTHTLLAVDLTGDGYPDLATADYTDGGTPNVSVLRNDGSGGFAAPEGYRLPVGGEAQFIATGDLDLDGALDIAAVVGRTLALLYNDGGGTFAEPIYRELGIETSVVAAADLDGDGKVDLAVKGWAGDMSAATRRLLFFRNEQTSWDRDRDGIPDECGQAVVLVEKGDEWSFFRGLVAAPQDWRDPSFDDGAWERGPTGIGYGDGDDATVLADMRGLYVTVYLRKALDVPPGLVADGLELQVDYDDGFIAYLNGVEVARSQSMGAAGTPFAFDEPALETHEAGTTERFHVPAGALLSGRNALAVEVRNNGLESTDLSFIPRLVATTVPPELEVSSAEVRAGEAAEVRVLLTSGQPVQAFSLGVAHDPRIATLTRIDLEGCPEMTGLNGGSGPDFFGVDLDARTSGCPGEVEAGGTFYCIASKGVETIPPGASIPVGRLVYRTAAGAAAGAESSLSIVGCLGDVKPWKVVLTIGGYSVRPLTAGGSLRIVEASQAFRRGDANADGISDISDAVTILLYLFAGRMEAVGCDDAADSNDDGEIDISDAVVMLLHLFGPGAPLPEPSQACGIDGDGDELRCEMFGPCSAG